MARLTTTRREVNRVSSEQADVLAACLERGRVSIAWLVRRRVQRGVPMPIARASLSRTLRRLWRTGLVELTNDWGWALTEHYAAVDEQLAAHERDPDAVFANQLAAIARGVPGFFPFATAGEYLAFARRSAAKRKRGKPMRYVSLTPQGRDLVERLITRRREVNQTKDVA